MRISSKVIFIPRPLSRPYNYTEARLQLQSTTVESVFNPGTAASVMARPGTLCIATVTVLVILAAAVPGEH